MPDTFDLATGEKVKIAIIDDGVWPGQFLGSTLIGGAQIVFDEKEGILVDDNWSSQFSSSHGTRCAAIINRRVPNAQLYSLKVLNGVDYSHPLSLAEALKWAVNHEINILNISLGTTGQQYISELHKQFVAATQAGVIIIAATHSGGLKSYPSAFPETIGVGKDDRYQNYQYGYYPGRLAEFVASPQAPVLEKAPVAEQTYVDVSGGTSFAAARMTANTAALLEIMPKLDLAQVKDELAARQTKLRKSFSRLSKTLHSQSEQTVLARNTESLPIKRAAIYPYDRNTELLLAFRDQFNFKIDCVVDPAHPSMLGKDAGSLFGLGNIGIPVISGFNQLKPETDTLIIGDLENSNKLEHKDFLHSALEFAVRNNKNIFNLGPAELHTYHTFCNEAQKKHLSFLSVHDVMSDMLMSDPSVLEFNVDVPVVGVFGTSFNQAKFTTQLALRRSMQKEGYEVALVGTNPICALLKNGFYLNQDRRSLHAVEPRNQAVCCGIAMAKAFEARPHLIIVGSQGATVPPSPYKTAMKDILLDLKDFPPDYTLPALALLAALKLDGVILAINSADPEQYIARTITVIENLSGARVIALAMANKLVSRNQFEYSQAWGRTLTLDEIAQLRLKYHQVFGLPLYCPFIVEDQNKLAETVVESFAVD